MPGTVLHAGDRTLNRTVPTPEALSDNFYSQLEINSRYSIP